VLEYGAAHYKLQKSVLKFIKIFTQHNSEDIEKRPRLAPHARELINNLDHLPPKLLHVQLQRDQNESQIIPTLLQIQNYIKYRRIAMGNANDIDEATEFVKKLAYKPRLTKSCLYLAKKWEMEATRAIFTYFDSSRALSFGPE
jgi:hypothetical protein